MNIEELISTYPRLYHMAANGSWPNIQKNGLQSTRVLLDRYEVVAPQRNELLRSHRPECVSISHPKHPVAVIRDQKPMSDGGLEKALGDSCSPSDWYELLNNMVFFWLSESRLRTMLSAKAYRDQKHDVLTIDSRSLIMAHRDNILLSPMNSGNTKPYPHPRTPDIFQTISNFPFAERRKTRPIKNTVVELTVKHSVPDIADHVLNVRNISIEDL